MVRETRYLWIGNLPEKITEEKILEKFSGHGKIQSVKFLPGQAGAERRNAIVAFMDIKSASKAHNSENVIDDVAVSTQYSEPASVIAQRGNVAPPAARPQEQEVTAPAGSSAPRDGSTGTTALTAGHSASQKSATGRFPNKTEGHSDDKSASSRSSFEAAAERKFDDGDQSFPDRGRSKQRYYPPARSGGFPGKFESGSQSFDQGRVKQLSRQHKASPTSSEPSAQRQHGPAQGSKSFQGSRSRSRSWGSSGSSSSGSLSSTSRSRSRSKDKAASRKKTVASTVAQPSSGKRPPPTVYTGILIRGFPVRSTDTSIRDGLFHEYKKYGKVMSVSIIDNGKIPRHAVVTFKKSEDAKKSLEMTHGKVFFGAKINVTPHEGFDVDDSRYRPPEAEQDEYHHKATRTLFVGNLEKEISKELLRELFDEYGYIIDIDIKKQGTQASYAFIQYDDIKSVVRALRDMDGELIGTNKVKLGFGKSMPTNCVWMDNVSETVSDKFLFRTFTRYGPVTYEVIDRDQSRALIYYESIENAQRAVSEMRGRALSGKKIQIDFASMDCQTLFYDNLERLGVVYPEGRPEVEKPAFTAPGYDRSTEFRGRGRFGYRKFSQRGNFRQQGANFQRGSQRGGFYEGSYEEGFEGARRTGRYYEQYSGDGPDYEDSYEQELREYYNTRERGVDAPSSTVPEKSRRESRAESPYSKSGRFQSPQDRYDATYEPYPENFRDTDSQSGDRESVRSFHSETRKEYKDRTVVYNERFSEKISEDTNSRSGREARLRGQSPTSSEYSYRSKSPPYTRQRSRSASPVSLRDRKGKDRPRRTHSPTTPTQDECGYGSQTENSVDILSGKRDHRTKKSEKHREYSDRESDKFEREDRTSVKSKVSRISQIPLDSSDKHSSKYCRSKEDLMEVDKSVLTKPSKHDRHWKQSSEDLSKKKKVPTATLR